MINIDKEIEKIAITKRMYFEAGTHYKNLAEFLVSKDIECEIYPQGSFAYGAITKPINKEGFDIDLICEIKHDENSYPKKLMEKIKRLLNESDDYKELLKEHDNGFSLEYKMCGYNFLIDIIPAVSPSSEKILEISQKTEFSQFASSSILIPSKCESNFRYINSNPKGLKLWFDEINKDILLLDESHTKSITFNDSYLNYSSYEDIPDEYIITNLQKCIMLLKRNRDVYYQNKKDVNKPISGAICVLAATACKYKKHFVNLESMFREIVQFMASLHSNPNILFKDSHGKWNLLNPANGLDNLVDSWSSDNDFETFNKWIKSIEKSIPEINERATILNMLGLTNETAKEINTFNKPWKND
ncbi:MAG: hypothetical protein R3Y60_05860 [bacterium]